MARGLGKAREYDYSNVGTAGRRTGLTLKEGRRDEHGMEEVDGLFSSPEKSPAKLNGFDENDDSIGSDMSIEDGNAPGPMDFLNAANRSQNLPAPSQSPVKGSTRIARRSPVLQSSPEPEQDMSSPSDGKSLLSTNGNTRQDPSPLSARSVNAGPKSRKDNPLKAKVVPETTVNDFSDEEEHDENTSFAFQDDLENSFEIGNDTVVQEEIPEVIEQDLDASDSDSAEAPEQPHRAEKTTKPTKKEPTAKATKDTKSNSKPGRRGRTTPARPADEEMPEARPAKKQKVSKETRPQEPLDPELDRVVENYSQRSGPLKGRSLYILKRENPADGVSTHTRSGRVSVRPLAYWRNERCVYGDGEAAEGQRYPLSTIKEVIRTEELEPERKSKGKGVARKSKSSKSKKQKGDSSDEEDENMDEWEKDTGILHGIVPKWDPLTSTSTTDEEVIDIAYAPSGIKTREVKGSSFRFAKLLSSSFIGSGVVELPPEGVKKPKNSKKMHMVFFVCHGRVQVDISDVRFSAGKGCVFQVPRGSHYSFANPYDKYARLFFTQGCIPDEGEELPTAESKGDAQDSGPEAESAQGGPSQPKPAKARGRKGKQKAGK